MRGKLAKQLVLSVSGGLSPRVLFIVAGIVFSLRIADGLGQHIAQLVLSLRGFPLRWLPFCH